MTGTDKCSANTLTATRSSLILLPSLLYLIDRFERRALLKMWMASSLDRWYGTRPLLSSSPCHSFREKLPVYGVCVCVCV